MSQLKWLNLITVSLLNISSLKLSKYSNIKRKKCSKRASKIFKSYISIILSCGINKTCGINKIYKILFIKMMIQLWYELYEFWFGIV